MEGLKSMNEGMTADEYRGVFLGCRKYSKIRVVALSVKI